jgi:formamidopyrimidine-DNA glycosylase
MPELPEITVIAGQMNETIKKKRIADADIKQPKNLNMSVKDFLRKIKGKTVKDVSSKGKWLFLALDSSYDLLINLGMGAEILYFKPDQKLQENAQFKLNFSDKTGLTIHFWWFGYIHLVSKKEKSKHKLTGQLGMPPTDEKFTPDYFRKLLAGKKTGVKSFLLDQKNVAGIGNVYIQDILFKAKLHPSRKISTLSEKETTSLYKAIREVLNNSIGLGGAAFELDFYGHRGRFTSNNFLVGYKPGKLCPECGTTIEKIRTGSTASYVCSHCQQE